MFRTVISLILLLSMMFAMSAYLGIYKLRQFQVRKEMKTIIKAGVPDSLHVMFSLNDIEWDSKNFQWIHSKEFRYKNEMYDILSKKEVNGDIVLVCIKDVKESGLFKSLEAMVNFQMNNDPIHQNQRTHWIKLFNSLYIQNPIELAEITSDLKATWLLLDVCIKSRILDTNYPPPQF